MALGSRFQYGRSLQGLGGQLTGSLPRGPSQLINKAQASEVSSTDTPAGKEGCHARPGQGKGMSFWLWISAGPGNTFYTNGPSRSKVFLCRQDARGGGGGPGAKTHPDCAFHTVSQYPPQGMRKVYSELHWLPPPHLPCSCTVHDLRITSILTERCFAFLWHYYRCVSLAYKFTDE